MPLEHKQIDFSGGLNRLENPAKIGVNEYYFLSNARIRDGGLAPVKLPQRQTLGLPNPYETVEEDYSDPDTGEPPPPTTTRIEPDFPPYEDEPGTWPIDPPFGASDWPPVVPIMEDPPVKPGITEPGLPECESQQVYSWFTSDWMIADSTVGQVLKAPPTVLVSQDPSEVISLAILTWWESRLVASFASWADLNGISYDAFEVYWEWNDTSAGIDAFLLHETGQGISQPYPGWELKLAYCENNAASEFYVAIKYLNSGEGCSDSVISGAANEVSVLNAQPVVFLRSQGPTLHSSVQPDESVRVFLFACDQAFRDNAFGVDGDALAFTFTARHYEYNYGTSICDLGTNYLLSLSYADVSNFMLDNPGSGTEADPYIITLVWTD